MEDFVLSCVVMFQTLIMLSHESYLIILYNVILSKERFFQFQALFDFRVAFCYAEFLGIRKQAIYLRVWLPLFGLFMVAFSLLGGRSQLWYLYLHVYTRLFF